MAVFAKYLTDSKSWYIEALRKKALTDAANTDGWGDDIWSFIIYHIESIKLLSAWFLWIGFGSMWVAFTHNWSCIDSLFFALSALSSGGRVAIPDDSPDRDYIIIGLYVMTGIPVMAIATGVIAHAIVFKNESVNSLNKKMMVRMTETELELMKAFGIEDGSGDIDAQEFVILTLVRIGALEPELIHYITGLYDSLTVDSSGMLTYETLQNMQTLTTSPNTKDRLSLLNSSFRNNSVQSINSLNRRKTDKDDIVDIDSNSNSSLSGQTSSEIRKKRNINKKTKTEKPEPKLEVQEFCATGDSNV